MNEKMTHISSAQAKLKTNCRGRTQLRFASRYMSIGVATTVVDLLVILFRIYLALYNSHVPSGRRM